MGQRKQFKARTQRKVEPFSALVSEPNFSEIQRDLSLSVEDRLDVQDHLQSLDLDLTYLERTQGISLDIQVQGGEITTRTQGDDRFGVTVSLSGTDLRVALTPTILAEDLACFVFSQIQSPRINYFVGISDGTIDIEGRTNVDAVVDHSAGTYRIQARLIIYGQ